MADNVADFVLRRLREWGVEQVFAYPGDGINAITASFGKAGDQPRFIQARHEEMAAFEAVGYAKFADTFGVCLATSGPGAVHLLNGLYDAKLDHVPVVAIVGQTARSAMGGSYQQELDLQALYKDVASEYLVEVNVPEQLPNALDRAIRTALAERAPTALIIPADVQELDYTPPQHAFKHVPSSPPGLVRGAPVPPEQDIAKAADIIDSGAKVAILAGQGARQATTQLRELAELTGGGIAKALLGKDVLPDHLPYVTGAAGLLGTRPSYELMRDCDTLVIVGSNFPYSQFLPDFERARAIQIDLDGKFIGMRYPTEVNLIGDAASTLSRINALVHQKNDWSWRQTIEANVTSWWDTMEKQARVSAEPTNPMRLVWELSQRIPSDAMITSDSGSAANWYARHLKIREGMRASLSGTLATMGPGVPYAIGAKFAHPERPSIALVGDGAMQMNGMAELLTLRRYFPRWHDPRCIVCVLHNNDLNQVTWELRAMTHSPKFEESQNLPEVSYAAFAHLLGLDGVEVTEPEAIGPAWDRAVAADRPFILDIHCDPSIPPIPPHATLEQMKSTTESMLRGDPDAWNILVHGAKTKLQEFLPSKS
ncbi:thiamine pyrophosphate-requiring protein [Sciscionella sediminilitoris]|uniref:thiamine pyrophosphate-requiring protein n=1 Tax=Sciscionella sediminilitoris TaxID=1445613 RepID=UPI0004DF0AA2|nr:thiamine pyrophosphate-requiring protein [Sciscionella sp. SE31]